jgi:predicted PurR-regulated permease PerM
MKLRALNFQKTGWVMVIGLIIGYILVIAKEILMPLTFAILFSFMLKPLCDLFEKWTKHRVFSIFLTFLVVTIPVIGILMLFSFQSVDVFQDIPAISEKVEAGINKIFRWSNRTFGLSKTEGKEWLSENSPSVVQAPIAFIAKGLSSSTALIANLGLIGLYTFFFLLYRTSVKYFLLIQFDEKIRHRIRDLFRNIQKVGRQYLFGLSAVILILGFANSIGLMLIGIDYAFFWGFLGAFLAIIPYIGTFIGGLLPFTYALATTDSLWQPASIILLYGVIQAVEGNLITPNVVGNSVKINPFAALFSLIIGGSIWGLGGLILALPVVAIHKVIFSQIDALKPLSLLLSDDVYERKGEFFEKYDEPKYRLFNLFRKEE